MTAHATPGGALERARTFPRRSDDTATPTLFGLLAKAMAVVTFSEGDTRSEVIFLEPGWPKSVAPYFFAGDSTTGSVRTYALS